MSKRNGQLTVPTAPDLEAGFIGACMMEATSALGHDVLRTVSEDCFMRPLWRACWRHIRAAWEAGEEADPVTIAHRVAEERGEDGGVTLAEILSTVSGVPCWQGYAPQRAVALRELATRRALMQLGHEAQLGATDKDLDGALAYTLRAAEMLDAEAARDETGELDEVADAVEHAADSGDAVGIPTQIPHYDEWAGGLRSGEVHVVAGNTGIGKTWLLCQIANAAVDAGERVAFFSLEMPVRSLWVRMLAGRIGMVAFRLMGRGKTWSKAEHAAYEQARDKLRGSGLRLFAEQRSVADIAAVVRQYQPAVFLVDYAQLLDAPPDTRSQYEAITANANALQRLAIKAHSTCILASQQSREAVKMGPHGAVLGGLGSGRIDQVADFWLLLTAEENGDVKLTNRKCRHGPTGANARYRLSKDLGRLVPI